MSYDLKNWYKAETIKNVQLTEFDKLSRASDGHM